MTTQKPARERAKPMSPEERRAAIVTAARPLFLEHGHATTTRLVAEAAGVAEGTIFRAFATKEELVDAVLDAEFDPQVFLDQVEEIDLELPLEERLVAATTLLQRRFLKVFHLMTALGLTKPPERVPGRGVPPPPRHGGHRPRGPAPTPTASACRPPRSCACCAC